MYCITREPMKFGEYLVPARTRATVVGCPSSRTVNVPGVSLRIAVTLFNIHPDREKGVKSSKIRIDNELENGYYGNTKSQMIGIEISTRTDQVYMDADDEFYTGSFLEKWKAEKVLGMKMPEDLPKRDNFNGYSLWNIVSYLDEKFADWVRENCERHILTEQDIEDGMGLSDSSPGDWILSPKGLEQFEEKKLEYQGLLERIGFTYDFKGGLIWE